MIRKCLNLPMAVASFCLLALITLSSCSRQQDYTNAIPADATEVLSVNLQTLAQKAGLQEGENRAALSKLTEALKTGLSVELQQQIETLMENPKNLGIDYTAPIYFFHASQAQGMVAKISDPNKLKSFLQTAQQDELFMDLQQTGDYSYAYNERLFLAFNKTTLLALPTPSSMDIGQMHNNAKLLFSQTEENSIRLQNFFTQLQELKGDINGLIASESLRDFYLKQGITQLPEHVNLKNLKILGSLNFKNGRIELQGSIYTEDEKLKTLIEQQAQSTHPANGKYLSYFPQSTLSLLTMGIDGEKLYESLQSEKSVRDQLTPEQSAFLQTLLGAFRKDVTIGITGMSASGNLSFVAYAETNDDTILQSFSEQIVTQGLNSYLQLNCLDNGDYQLRVGSQRMYLGIRGTDVFVTNDNLQYNRIAQKAEPSIAGTDYATDLEGQHAAIIVNAKAVFDMPLVRMAIGFLSPEYRTYANMAENISYVGLSGQSDSGQLFLVLKDKNTNALKQLLNFINTFIGI